MEIEKVTQEKLSTLKGKILRLWRFIPTHDQLTYEIPGEENKYLIFLMCETIKTHIGWKVENPKLTRIDKAFIKIEDTNFEIVCQEIIFNDEYFGKD